MKQDPLPNSTKQDVQREAPRAQPDLNNDKQLENQSTPKYPDYKLAMEPDFLEPQDG